MSVKVDIMCVFNMIKLKISPIPIIISWYFTVRDRQHVGYMYASCASLIREEDLGMSLVKVTLSKKSLELLTSPN